MKNVVFAFLLYFPILVFGQYKPTQANLDARKEFENARFGMFIHWGVSSSLANGEWVMNNRDIHVENYNRLKDGFYPANFDAAKIVGLAKNAGMRYITLITRHHDGFSNWDTKESDWKISNTPFKRDVVKEMADECHKQGIKIFAYYSLLDWYRSDYQYETGRTGKGTGRTKKSDWESYIKFMKAQLRELLTNYGEISGIWFDGHWDQLDNDHDKSQKSKVNWHYDEIYSLIHQLQPRALVGNNHHLSPIDGEDFQMFEKDLPGKNAGGLSGQEISNLPLETCETINNSWGYSCTDLKYKSTKTLIQYLVNAAGKGANFLLNIGPMPDGTVQPEFVERLEEVGKWMKLHEESIRGTSAGFESPDERVTFTKKGNRVFMHLLENMQDFAISLPNEIVTAKELVGGNAVKFKNAGMKNYVVFDLSTVKFNENDTVIELLVK